MKISKEFIIGLVILAAIGLGIYGVEYLKGTDLLDTQNKYYAIYDNIDGLEKANPVTYNGFKIGIVKDIGINPDNQQTLLVTLVITEEKIKIPKDSRLVIISSDILGSKAVDLYMGNMDVYAQPGDTLNAELEAGLKESVNKELAPLKNKAENLIQSVDQAIQVVKAVFDKDAQQDLNEGIASIRETFKSLQNAAAGIDSLVSQQRRSIGATIRQIEGFTATLEKNSERIDRSLANIEKITDSLSASNLTQAINNAEKAMTDVSEIMTKVNEGNGTLGKLVNDDSLFVNMLEATKNLEYLLEDIRIHPNRYVHLSVFGTREKGTALTREQERKIEKLLNEK